MTPRARSAAIAAGVVSSLFAGSACHPGSRSTSSATPFDASAPATGVPCGALECMQYDTPREAFVDALARVRSPLILGVGEAHRPRGASVPSAATRFTDELLPVLAGRASDLLLELMMPPAGCVDAVAQVRRDQEPVTSRHAETDADEYVAMGERARALGTVPDMLRPTCADMEAIKHAGEGAVARGSEGADEGPGAHLEVKSGVTRGGTDADEDARVAVVDVSLTTIARLARNQAARLADRDALSDADGGKMVVLYGGALHNDLAPAAESARWSYAPALDAHVHGRFTAIDLVVPEFIGLDETWARLPWWPYYDKGRLGRKATLFRTDPQSFVLVFPVGAPSP